ncbi:MAG: protein phosphatase CheZ [Deltaproteobacteria bacterium]|nr:protein phosphatase CheZ [Deltaproteobacteria bacterium]
MAQHIGFKLGVEEYSVPILSVREIINVPEMTRMPSTPDYIEGVANLRGSVVPIVSTRKVVKTGQEAGAAGEGDRVIVLINGKAAYGILVDGITGVIGIDETTIDPPEKIMNGGGDQFVGVAKCNGRLIVVLDPKKLLPGWDTMISQESEIEIRETADAGTVEVVRKMQTIGGDVEVRELRDAKEFLSKKIDPKDPSSKVIEGLMAFMDAVASKDYAAADALMEQVVKSPQDGLFQEVGKVTRRLHDSLKSFKDAIDPKISSIVQNEMPTAVDQLQFCLRKTEEAANKTMGIVEKHLLQMDDLAANIRKLQGPEDAVKYIKDFKNGYEDDLTEIITTQSFQDLTGQTIQKVILLVADIEKELVGMVAAFGLKLDMGAKESDVVQEKVNQAGVDDLLKEFGF